MTSNSNKHPFFIVGIGRSGTTLLRLMFNAHPAIAVPYESHFITDYYRNRDRYGDLSDPKKRKSLVVDILNEDLLKQWDHQFDAEQVLQRSGNNGLDSVFNAIYEDYMESKGKKRWADKSDYLDRMHIIHEIFPDAKFIHIIRDGRDVANSVMKLDWGPGDIIQAAEWWNFHIILGRRMGSILGPGLYAEVKYEELVTNTERELTRLCEFVGEAYSKNMLEYYKNSVSTIPSNRLKQHYNSDSPPKTSRVYAWKTEMNQLQLDIFNGYARKALDELGYEVTPAKTNHFFLNLFKLWVIFVRFLKLKKKMERPS